MSSLIPRWEKTSWLVHSGHESSIGHPFCIDETNQSFVAEGSSIPEKATSWVPLQVLCPKSRRIYNISHLTRELSEYRLSLIDSSFGSRPQPQKWWETFREVKDQSLLQLVVQVEGKATEEECKLLAPNGKRRIRSLSTRGFAVNSLLLSEIDHDPPSMRHGMSLTGRGERLRLVVTTATPSNTMSVSWPLSRARSAPFNVEVSYHASSESCNRHDTSYLTVVADAGLSRFLESLSFLERAQRWG